MVASSLGYGGVPSSSFGARFITPLEMRIPYNCGELVEKQGKSCGVAKRSKVSWIGAPTTFTTLDS
jgi:hypothetical protein